ncbi:hypothetical protein PPERSA_09364 [Pseudocohnilembus persalinus]|uniref:Uncharacterized protein n=1 Tax=Pseudocohnilembus persalinus TaxID=266149 RepID=A0A0V0QY71_PSEPJ|nr:hypothetical protein PPERSA_09364 [Pseudocohnilembus persalinus]|eukprot:KRX07150.1 hypothetical protein PPERSA_09364 [Pseudocohnilembus persalinus]
MSIFQTYKSPVESELLNHERFWSKHMSNLKEKTIIKKKIWYGDIFPEHKTGFENKKQTQFNLTNLVRSIKDAEIIKEGEPGYLEIIGNKPPIKYTDGVFYNGKEKAELQPHLQKPFIYAKKIYDKKTFEQLQHEDNKNYNEEQKEQQYQQQDDFQTGNRFFDRIYQTSNFERKQKIVKKPLFWNKSTNTQSLQVMDKVYDKYRFSYNPREYAETMGNLINKMNSLKNQEERQEFQAALIRQQDEIQRFLLQVRKLIKYEKYTNKTSFRFTQTNFLSQPNLQDIWKTYLQDKQLSLNKTNRTEHILVTQQEFIDFILSIGWPEQDEELIQKFFNCVYDEIIFKNANIREFVQLKLAKKPIPALISMRAFFWNFNKLIREKKKIQQQYSHIKSKQVNVNIKELLKPWKYQFSKYKANMKSLEPEQNSVIQIVSELDNDLSTQIKEIIEKRDYLIQLQRVISNNIYKVLTQEILEFQSINDHFVAKILKYSRQMSLLQEFVEGFKQYQERNFMNNEDVNLTNFTLVDFAEYIRREPYDREEFLIKNENEILRLSYIIYSLIKLTFDYSDVLDQEAAIQLQNGVESNEEQQNKDQLKEHEIVFLNRIQQILNLNSIPKEFTRKFLFSEKILAITRKTCEQGKQQADQYQQGPVDEALFIFTKEAEKLQDILYQWKYPNFDENSDQEDENNENQQDKQLAEMELNPQNQNYTIPDNEGKIINVLDAVQKSHKSVQIQDIQKQQDIKNENKIQQSFYQRKELGKENNINSQMGNLDIQENNVNDNEKNIHYENINQERQAHQEIFDDDLSETIKQGQCIQNVMNKKENSYTNKQQNKNLEDHRNRNNNQHLESNQPNNNIGNININKNEIQQERLYNDQKDEKIQYDNEYDLERYLMTKNYDPYKKVINSSFSTQITNIQNENDLLNNTYTKENSLYNNLINSQNIFVERK